MAEKQKRPNNSRWIDNEIRVILTRSSVPLTAREIREALPAPAVSDSAVRGNLGALARRGIIEPAGTAFSGGRCWRIIPGMEARR